MFCHLKEVKQLRKVKITQNLSPTHIATICGALCSSNCMEEIEVISEASVLSVCCTPPYRILLL